MTAAPAGGRPGFEAWARDRRPALLRTAVALTRDTDVAEDLLQVALLKVFVAWDRVRDPAALDGYARTVLTNTVRSWWRGGARREAPVAQLPDADTGRDAFAAVEARAELEPLLRGLPGRAATVVVLRYLEDRSVDETAALLGVSKGTVKSQAHRALGAMRERASLVA